MCNCKLCKRTEEMQRQLETLTPAQREYWEAMYELLLNVEMDLDYANAVIDGSWPEADEHIQGVRARVTERRARRATLDKEAK